MTRFHNINGIRIQFTPEEEIARDEEERVSVIEDAVIREKTQNIATLVAKLADDSLTFAELKELMRLRG